ncbi:MAG: hypothetical protein J6A28_04685 [Clostridia bacterium]|nr:hypothetical protein [Clostridia bacterium]
MKIFKSYGFWTAFAGAVVILINALGDLFGFKIESKLVENVIMAIAGVLVTLGVVSIGNKKFGSQEEKVGESEEAAVVEAAEKQEESQDDVCGDEEQQPQQDEKKED